jgi:hypothetical protein
MSPCTVSLQDDIAEVRLFQVLCPDLHLSGITIQPSNHPLQKPSILNIFWRIRRHAEAGLLMIMPAMTINVLIHLIYHTLF